LPQPIREEIEVQNQLELNELETIWMFRFHTWRGYPGGMNLMLAGSQDYKNLGRISGRKAVENGHLARVRSVSGRKARESGHLARIASRGGRTQGRKNAENGHLASIASKGGRLGGRITNHERWHIKRGVVSPRCEFCRPAPWGAAVVVSS